MSAIDRTACCTICSKNYLHFARTLMGSVGEHQPGWDEHTLLVDRIGGYFDPAVEPFRVVEVERLPLPDPWKFLFRYTQLELSTAVKPWLLERLLFDEGYDRVVYLDPDIRLYGPLDELTRALDDGANIVLTPHLTGPLDDDRRPSELDILRSGSWNLGFIALRRSEEVRTFLRWWQKKLEHRCVVDPDTGIFVDQKWCDLVPGMFEGVFNLRNDGYNVAYWNLKHREVTGEDGRYLVNGVPLRFFHYSGLDPRKPEPFSRHQDRFRLKQLGVVRALTAGYCNELDANRIATCEGWPYAFATFADGTPIPDAARWAYRGDPELRKKLGTNPFETGHDPFNEPWGTPGRGPRTLVTRLMRGTWDVRHDLQLAFPDIAGRDRDAFADWFVRVVRSESDIPEAYLAPVRASLTHRARDTLIRQRIRATLRLAALKAKSLGRPLPTRVKEGLKRRFPILVTPLPTSPPTAPETRARPDGGADR